MKARAFALSAIVLLAGCAGTWESTPVVERSVQSMREMDAFMKQTGAQLWINHDMARNASIPKAPAFVE